MAVLLQTSVGDLTIDLYTDRVPLPCYNFLGLVRAKYYHNTIFHSVEKNFIARGGNPATASRAWGLGLPGSLNEHSTNEKQTDDVGCSLWGLRHLLATRQLNLRRRQKELDKQRAEQQGRLSLLPASVYADAAFELMSYAPFPEDPAPGTGIAPLSAPSCRFCPLDCNPKLKHTKKGMIGMLPHASGKAPGGASCFYFTLRPNLTQLDGRHSVFGEVVEGVDTLERINDAFVDTNHIPLTPVRIFRAYVLDDPFFCTLSKPLPAAAAAAEDAAEEEEEEEDLGELDNHKLGLSPPASPEPLAAEALSDEEKDEIMAIEKVDYKEAEARKVTLEILGDLPDADAAPPETVLFVAKLNPVTQDDDLRLLFSRFGEVVSCDIIRDSRTGQSLQYAFVGFKKKEECEAAYFKMQNVLVDDRRIHVDFSQSVMREWHAFKQQQKQQQQQQQQKGRFPHAANGGGLRQASQFSSFNKQQQQQQHQQQPQSSRGFSFPRGNSQGDFAANKDRKDAKASDRQRSSNSSNWDRRSRSRSTERR